MRRAVLTTTSRMHSTKMVVGVLIKDGHPAWPPPVSATAEFVRAETASELLKTPEMRALLWVPGIQGSEAAKCLRESKIEWIHSFSAGVDGLAPYLKEERTVKCTNGRGAFSSSLAEYVMASMLYFNKQIPRCQQNLRDSKWDHFRMPVLKGKVLGFVGYGHIAKETAALAKAFGMTIVAVRKNQSDDDIETWSPDEREKLFEKADFVVSSLPDTPETRDFCGAKEFNAMKPSAVFISIGRGAAVDEAALYTALSAGKIAGAALDVFKTEPLPSDSNLWSLPPDKLLLTAHNADLTDDYFHLGWNVWLDNFHAFTRNPESDLVTPFHPHLGY